MRFFTLKTGCSGDPYEKLHDLVFHGIIYSDIKTPEVSRVFFLGDTASASSLHMMRSGLFFPPIIAPKDNLFVIDSLVTEFSNTRTQPCDAIIDELKELYCKKGPVKASKYSIDAFEVSKFIFGQKKISIDKHPRYYQICCHRLREISHRYSNLQEVELPNPTTGYFKISISEELINSIGLVWQYVYILSESLFYRIEEYLDRDAFRVGLFDSGQYSSYLSDKMGSKVLWPNLKNVYK